MSLENKVINDTGKALRLSLQTLIGAKFGYDSLQSTINFSKLADEYAEPLKGEFGNIIYWSFQIGISLGIATVGAAITYIAVKYSGKEMKKLFENF